MSTLVFVDPESSTQADGAQSSRVPVPLPEDPYEAIRQAYLDGTDTESEPFEDPIDTETLESPLAIAPPIPLSESTPPVLVPILRRTARMAVRVPPTMSSGLTTSMAGVAAMSKSALRKRFQSSFESSPYVSPPDLPSRKRYRGTSELVEDSEEGDDEEDEEIEESMDSDSLSEDAEDEGPTTKDEDPAAEDEGLTAGVEGHGMDDLRYGLDDKSHAPVMGTVVSAPLGLRYRALRRRELALEDGDVYSTFEVGRDPEEGMIYIDIPDYPPPAPPLPEWTSGGLIHDHAIRLEELPPALFERYDRDIGELFTRSGAVRQEIFSQRYWFKSQTNAYIAALWHAISDVQGENQDLQLQLAEERRARLELAKAVDGMRRGQEPRGVVMADHSSY
ncbi:hypothetical protein Tco_0622570 [Tanacetum coccineum]